MDRGFPDINDLYYLCLSESQSLLKWIGDSLVFRDGPESGAIGVAILVKVDRGFPDFGFGVAPAASQSQSLLKWIGDSLSR